jgi:hypothetical protein
MICVVVRFFGWLLPMAENGGILNEKRQLWHFKVRRQKRWHFKCLPFFLFKLPQFFFRVAQSKRRDANVILRFTHRLSSPMDPSSAEISCMDPSVHDGPHTKYQS